MTFDESFCGLVGRWAGCETESRDIGFGLG